MKIHNFSAGPGILPNAVLKKSSQAIINFNNSGLSILEVSHRSKIGIDLIQNTEKKIKQITKLGSSYKVLFLQGGASLQFIMVPYNLMQKNKYAGYLDTGIWSLAAIKEAKKFGNIEIIASSKDTNYDRIPRKFKISNTNNYTHITTNNTIFGTQIKNFNFFNAPLIADMSSDIFSKNINFNQFDLIYAGAQKNIGPAGVTLVIIKKSLIQNIQKTIPSYLNYNTHILQNGIFNTPNMFGIYTIYENLLWLEKLGGLKKIEKINEEKSKLLYDEIDRNPLFKGHSIIKDRSNMNITFSIINNYKKDNFDNMLKEKNILGLNGHRLVGGYRASIYNAMPIDSIKLLIDTMQKFEKNI